MDGVGTPVMWIGFSILVLVMLGIDLLAAHRREGEEPTIKSSAMWSAVWIGTSIAFGVGLGALRGWTASGEFFTAFLLEKALSVDNLFVFLLLFSFFAVPPPQRHKVLFWGVLGALACRLVFILAGAALLARFEWLLYIFGAILIFTAAKLMFRGDNEPDPSKSLIVRLFRRFIPTTPDFRDGHFVVRENGKLLATPLLMVLVAIEATDIVFAFDSIPAVFGVTQDPFIVYTSNIFAILGLRALYFLLAGVLEKLEGLETGLAAVLAFVGVKMLASHWIHVPIGLSFAAIAALLALPPVFVWARRRGTKARASESGGRT